MGGKTEKGKQQVMVGTVAPEYLRLLPELCNTGHFSLDLHFNEKASKYINKC